MKYTIGLDFGTLSGRAVLVDTSDGREAASAVFDYPHAVIDDILPSGGEKLPGSWALEDPSDYIAVMKRVIPEVIAKAGADVSDVIGICVDFTCCTAMPIYADGTPLCFTEKWKNEKNAWVKLWKHHSTQSYADRINDIYRDGGYGFLSHLGGKMSSEWMLPKLWETIEEAPGVYGDCDYFIECGDWINLLLTGKLTRNYLMASFKSCYIAGKGYPPEDFLIKCNPGLADAFSEKLSGPVVMNGMCIGRVTEKAAAEFGLCPGTAVAAAVPDAHVAAFSLGIKGPGDLFGIMGTSNCYFLASDKPKNVPGICGCVENGLIDGYYGYEAGLCCVGDHFAWAAENLSTPEYAEEAKRLGISNLKLLISKASEKKPGETGLVALDWWNGNRNILVNGLLSGLIVGLTLKTAPEDIMRALIEATAFGTRTIFENYKSHGLEINHFIAAGGIARKDPFTMQLYADVLHMPVHITSTTQAPALGCAILAAAAAGSEAGGYSSVNEAVEAMKVPETFVYMPDEERGKIYDRLYSEYMLLHDWFGRGGNDVMMRLRSLAEEIREA
ncbi:MAG: ribulokinase [Clostridia bacterium]|nr:ribulokinase [Clostridia bacterium]